MRTIRLKINEAVDFRLRALAAQLAHDVSFVLDVYSLIALGGSGIPSDKRVEALTTKLAAQLSSELSARILVRKRVQTLRQLVKLPYFQAICALPDKLASCERLLRKFSILGKLNRRSECMSCSLYAQCDFGKQYAQTVTNVSKVIDPDYKKKVHQDCPSLPELDKTNGFNEIIKFMAGIVDPNNSANNQIVAQSLRNDDPSASVSIDPSAFQSGDEEPNVESDDSTDPATLTDDPEDYESTVGRMSKGKGRFDSTFDAEYYVKTQETLIDSLVRGGMELFKISEQLGNLMQQGHSTSYKPTPAPSAKKKTDTLKSSSDIGDLQTTEHALPDEEFDARLAKKTLKTDRNTEPSKKKQLLYLLVDSSASMRTQYSQHTGIISRASFSRLVCTALLKKIRDEGGYVYLRFFDSYVSDLTAMKKPDQFDDMVEKIKTANYNGGGTDILRAVTAAHGDIEKARDELSRAEVLLITDAEDRISNFPTNLFSDIGLNVLDVSGQRPFFSGPDIASAVLKRVAKRYYKADEKYIDLSKIVSLV